MTQPDPAHFFGLSTFSDAKRMSALSQSLTFKSRTERGNLVG